MRQKRPKRQKPLVIHPLVAFVAFVAVRSSLISEPALLRGLPLPLFTESPRRLIFGNPYSPGHIPTRDRQKRGWMNILPVSRSRTATPEGPQLGSPRCRVIVGLRSYCIGAFPAAVAFVPPLSLLLAKVLWYSSDSQVRSRDTPSLKGCAPALPCAFTGTQPQVE